MQDHYILCTKNYARTPFMEKPVMTSWSNSIVDLYKSTDFKRADSEELLLYDSKWFIKKYNTEYTQNRILWYTDDIIFYIYEHNWIFSDIFIYVSTAFSSSFWNISSCSIETKKDNFAWKFLRLTANNLWYSKFSKCEVQYCSYSLWIAFRSHLI